MSTAGGRALAAWLLVTAEVLLFGTSIFAIAVAAPVDPRAQRQTFVPFWRGLALSAFLASPLVLLVDAASMADTSLRDTIQILPEVIRQTHFGRVWLCDFVVVAAILVAAALPIDHPRKALGIAILSMTTLILGALSGHAIDHGTLAVMFYFLHEGAAALWIGAVLGLWIGVKRGGFDRDWLARTAPRVSRLAEWTVVILLLSGVYTAWYALDRDPRRLLYAAYGRLLLVKILAAIAVLLIGGYNRFFLIPTLAQSSSRQALLRNVAIESLLLIGVLGLAALLANTPPAH